jgi:hypothetical protein
MSGAFIHAPRFEHVWYTGDDGRRHYELMPVGGHTEVISHSSWKDLLEYFAARGVARDMWPTYETDIDIPLSEVVAQNERLRELVHKSSLGAECPTWTELVINVICSGEIFFYCSQ